MSFLPQDYKMPKTRSNYMKFEEGENRFRIMSSPIVGYEWWVNEGGEVRQKGDKPQSGDKPVRIRMKDKMPVDAAGNYKHFWAMVVYNHKEDQIQILQINQSSIQSSIENIVKDEDWGDPKGNKGYDLVVTRSGEGLDTTYSVVPKPRKELSEDIIDKYKSTKINLDALYDGDDPFATGEEVDLEELPDYL